MKHHRTELVAAILICTCVMMALPSRAIDGGALPERNASPARVFEGDFVLHREIPVDLAAGTREHPRLVDVRWVRVEPVYGNAWALTARVGWSPAAEATWRISVELLDDKERILQHARDEPTTFTGKAEKSSQGVMQYAELTLDPMHWEGRRHAAKIRIRLEPAEPPVVAPASPALEIAALDSRSGKPIPAATVVAKTSFLNVRRRSHISLSLTDTQGKCRLAPAGPGLAWLSVTLQKDGYATMMNGWSNPSSWPVDRVPLMNLPERHVMEMAPAQALGGVVQDQAGRPIAEARVRIETHLGEVGGAAHVSRSVQADQEGRWRVEGIPREADTVSLGFNHTEYVSDGWARRRTTGEELRALRNLQHVVTMTRGLTVSGRVLDEQGRPVSPAAVVLAPAYSGGFLYEHAYTLADASGRFRFGCAANDATSTTPGGGSTGVLVEAPGYVPVLQRIVVEPNLAPLEFRLSPGRTLTVRVVDMNDRPIAEASTVVHPLTEDPRYGRWLVDTDEQGRFQIPNAPEDDVLIAVLKTGYVAVRDHTLPASRDEHVIRMRPAPRIRGAVRDARTGEPIRDFVVGTVYEAGGGTRTGEPSQFKEGKFELTIDEATPESLQLKIVATGYAPVTSESIRLEGTQVLEFKLTKDPSFDAHAVQRELGGPRSPEPRVIKGTVVDPNGRPVPDVTVAVVGLYFPEAITDDEGKFKLRSPSGMGPSMERETPYLIARDRQHNLGAAAELDVAVTEDLTIKLSPGVVLSGKVTDAQGKGIPGTRILLAFRTTQAEYGIGEETDGLDPNGRYEIRAVPMGYRFSVNATAEGYGQEYIDVRTAEAMNDRMELEPIVLQPANLDISGTVVDAEDQPIPSANVYCYGRGQPHRQLKTDAQGRFTVRGVCAGIAQIQANTDGQTRLHGRVETEGGATDVKIVVSPTGTADRYVPAKPPSPIGKPLPSLADLGVESPADATKDRMILLCFFDMNQRPSRYCLTTLAKRADELKQKGVALIAVQAAEADENTLDEWLKEQGIAVPVGSIKADTRKTTFAWGVQSLPWLTLTDTRHVVRAEGFAVGELDGQIEAVRQERNGNEP